MKVLAEFGPVSKSWHRCKISIVGVMSLWTWCKNFKKGFDNLKIDMYLGIKKKQGVCQSKNRQTFGESEKGLKKKRRRRRRRKANLRHCFAMQK